MLDDARIEAIVQQVMAELRQGERVRHGPLPEPPAIAGPPPPARRCAMGTTCSLTWTAPWQRRGVLMSN